MKKVIAVFLLVLLCLPLSGCKARNLRYISIVTGGKILFEKHNDVTFLDADANISSGIRRLLTVHFDGEEYVSNVYDVLQDTNTANMAEIVFDKDPVNSLYLENDTYDPAWIRSLPHKYYLDYHAMSTIKIICVFLLDTKSNGLTYDTIDVTYEFENRFHQ